MGGISDRKRLERIQYNRKGESTVYGVHTSRKVRQKNSPVLRKGQRKHEMKTLTKTERLSADFHFMGISVSAGEIARNFILAAFQRDAFLSYV